MKSSDRRILIIIASILVVTCLCSLCIAAFSAFGVIAADIFSAATSSTTTTTTNPADPTTIDAEILSQMTLIERQVSELRGLQSSGQVIRQLYTPDDLRTRVMDDFFADYTAEEAAQDVLILSLMGLVPPDLDLHQLYIDLYSEGIAGFYDDETGEMVVVQDSGFGGLEQLTYAHEYLHALQDQNYDLDDGLGYNDDTCENDTEFCLALQALIEGDATLTEVTWFDEYAGERQRQEVFDFYSFYESPVYDSAPPFVQQDLLYAYTAGTIFVEYLFNQGGWPAVDAAYLDPPLTTEHILHPELYPDEQAVPVTLPDVSEVLGDTWQLLEEDTLGEWYTFLLLGHSAHPSASLQEFDARHAAAGWGGDRYAVYQEDDTGQLVMAVRHIWDNSGDAKEYAGFFSEYASARFGAPLYQTSERTLWTGDDGVHLLFSFGLETIWIFAPDEDTAVSIYYHITESD